MSLYVRNTERDSIASLFYDFILFCFKIVIAEHDVALIVGFLLESLAVIYVACGEAEWVCEIGVGMCVSVCVMHERDMSL